MFVDDDDLLVSNAIELYLPYFKNNIIYIFGTYTGNNDFSGLTGSVFNAAFIKNHNLRFSNLRYEEDSLFMETLHLILVRSNSKGVLVNKPIYIHTEDNEQSLCHLSQNNLILCKKHFFTLNIELCKVLLQQPNDFYTKDYLKYNFDRICLYAMNLFDNILDTKPLFDLLEKYSIEEIHIQEDLIIPFYKDSLNKYRTVKDYKEGYLNACLYC